MSDARPRLLALDLAASPVAWGEAGFAIGERNVVGIGATEVRLRDEGDGFFSWTLSGAVPDGDGTLEGVPTTVAAPPGQAAAATHANGVTAIDHVVLATPDTTRTFEALEASGFTLRRIRDASDTLRQGFFLFEECVLEVVGPPEPPPDGGAASIWGITLVAPDLSAPAFGPHLSAPRPAVQPGREIAVFDRAAGLGARVALMTPRA
ncbi:glyoxalase [Baekduia sp. Peel2402]|uniref:glyoxalase n=1 Tax=Baekduia sp. Peel2402 TaxID=3458296 RepID=UPI00403EE093